MNRERDEPRERRQARLSPAGGKILDELERSSEALEPPYQEKLARVGALPPSQRKEIAAIFGGTAQEIAKRQRENTSAGAQLASFEGIVQEAQEREKVAGRPVDPESSHESGSVVRQGLAYKA